MDSVIPAARIRAGNPAPVRGAGAWVLYWMTTARRLESNFALERAAAWALHLQRPLLIFEPVLIDYPWANTRFHQFLIEGLRDNAQAAERYGVTYFPYLEPHRGAGAGLMEALIERACVVIGDEFPAPFPIGGSVHGAPRWSVLLEWVDSNGLLPLGAAGKAFYRAHDFRRHLRKTLAPHLITRPHRAPLERLRGMPCAILPPVIARRWAPADAHMLGDPGQSVAALPVEPGIRRGAYEGGRRAGQRQLKQFIALAISTYHDDRRSLVERCGSGLSPYLHFGHISAHEIVGAALKQAGAQWKEFGYRAGGESVLAEPAFWEVDEGTSAFLDQLLVWRELSFNGARFCPGFEGYASLPAWAQRTLAKHRVDVRTHSYSLAELMAGQTHDLLWNAAQNQLREEGRLFNAVRMLWGKRVIEWTASAEEAYAILVELNNRFALDGRDPNSYAGISWCFGRYDRAWGPERPIFGTVRYLSSANTGKKLKAGAYLQRWANTDR